MQRVAEEAPAGVGVMRQIDMDVDPARVAAFIERRQAYALHTAGWGAPRRCQGGVCDGDGACMACDADQGVACRKPASTTAFVVPVCMVDPAPD